MAADNRPLSVLALRGPQVNVGIRGHAGRVFGEVVLALGPAGVFSFKPWGASVPLVVRAEDVTSAVSAESTREDFVRISRAQRAAIEAGGGVSALFSTKPRKEPPSDRELLTRVGADVDLVVQIDGRPERWRGRIVRAVDVSGIVGLRPAGCATEIEFTTEQVKEVRPYTPTNATSARNVELSNAQRVARRRKQ